MVNTIHSHFHFHVCVCVWLSRVQLFVILWAIAHCALLSMEFSKQEYWSVLPFPSTGHLPNPGIVVSLPTELPGDIYVYTYILFLES